MQNKTPFRLLAVAVFTVCVTACAGMSPSDPVATADGLVENSESRFREFYQKPGADLTRFSTIKLEPCKVAFKEDWMRRQNESRVDLSNRVRQEDVDRITNDLSASCDEKLRAALQQEPAYSLVEDGGANTLVLRPAIVDLDVYAPDLRNASARKSYTQSSGEMTLHLDFVDAASGEVVARAVDKRRGMDAGYLERTTSVSNKADANIALLRWGKLLRDTLAGT